MKKKLLLTLFSLIFLYFVSAGASYMIFANFIKSPINIKTPFGNISSFTTEEEDGVKDKECPLNGAYYTKGAQERWENQRPLAVMIENHVDARPLVGLSSADVIYEAVAEGGITRFMALFLCQKATDIAPIRSARTYFIDWLSEYQASYVHVGGANTPGPADALGQIREYGINDLDQFGLGFPTYWRGTNKLAPHNVHSTTDNLWEAAAKRDYAADGWADEFEPWTFKDEASLEQRGSQGPITVPFWTTNDDYTVTWQYDKNTNKYKRYHGQSEQVDPSTAQSIAPVNVVIQFQQELDANDGYPGGHLLYGTTPSGDALFFIDGKATEGTWNKEDREARSIYKDENGDEIEFNRGQIWIQTIPVANTVDY